MAFAPDLMVGDVQKDVDFSRGLTRAISDLAAWRIAAFFVAVGVGMLYLSAFWEGGDGPSPTDATLREVGALFVVTGAVSILWDLHGRRSLTDEVLTAARLSTEVQAAGITRVAKRYLDVDWDEHLRSSQHVDLFFTYGRTWRATHATALRQLVRRQGACLRVVLPDASDDRLMAQLAAKFRYDVEDLRGSVQDAYRDVENLSHQASPGAVVELRLTREFPVFTYYGFDRACVTVLYAQTPGRTDVPTLEMEKGGSLHAFFRDQFDELWNGSTPSA